MGYVSSLTSNKARTDEKKSPNTFVSIRIEKSHNFQPTFSSYITKNV